MSRKNHNSMPKAPKESRPKVPIAWEALEDAFENNAPEVHSYLHLETGEVIRIVDGIADPTMHQRVMRDALYLRIDPVSSREQYRWMERFIATVDDAVFRDKLVRAIDGKGAFRRFKDVLMSYPTDRERWFAFRSERLRSCMEAWLTAHGIEVEERTQWRVPTAEEVKPQVDPADNERSARRTRVAIAEAHRRRLHELVDLLTARDLDAAMAFLEFLRERKHLPRPRAKPAEPVATSSADAYDVDEPSAADAAADSKRADSETAGSETAEGRPAEGKRAEGKRADSKRADSKRAESKPADGKRAEPAEDADPDRGSGDEDTGRRERAGARRDVTEA
ncbi:MAG: UPF0158 family protein [Sandaracinaceae bacterium]